MHPGEVLREEFLLPLKLSAGALARKWPCHARALSASPRRSQPALLVLLANS
jgi:plasmid maintenance system antidote protein VapI